MFSSWGRDILFVPGYNDSRITVFDLRSGAWGPIELTRTQQDRLHPMDGGSRL
jgi:hypothetical protein